MNELRTLLQLELRAAYGINRFAHTRDKKEKSRKRLLLAVWVTMLAVAVLYVAGIALGLCSLGLGELLPTYLVAAASAMSGIFALFQAGQVLFGRRGYDILASLPLKPRNIVISRFLAMYAEMLLPAVAVLLPGVAVYGALCRPGAGFYLAALTGAVFVPAIPLVLASILGTAVMAVSSRMKHRSLVQSLLLVAVVLSSFRLSGLEDSTLSPEVLAQAARSAGRAIGRVYPPAVWLGSALTDGNLWGLALFAAVSVIVAVLAMALVARYFHAITGRLLSSTARHNYQLGAMGSRGMRKALYLREVRRYFSSSVYVSNTIIGPILGAIMAVALWASGVEAIQAVLPPEVVVAVLAPFAISAVFCLMNTTSCSISMEGRQVWIAKSLPIPMKALLDSKLLLNLSLALPCYLVAVAAMAMALKPDALGLLWLILIPGLLILFSQVLGITVDLRFHRFDWERETEVVKQGLSAMLGGFAGMVLATALAGAMLAVPPALSHVARLAVCLALALGTLTLYRRNSRAGMELL